MSVSEVVECEVWLVFKNTGEMSVLKSRSRSSTNNGTRKNIVCCDFSTTNCQLDCCPATGNNGMCTTARVIKSTPAGGAEIASTNMLCRMRVFIIMTSSP